MPTALLDTKKIADKYFNETPAHLSSFSFTNIFAWSDFFDFKLLKIKDSLCVFARNIMGSFMYLPPLGKDMPSEVIEQCFLIMEKENSGNGISRIENVHASQLKAFDDKRYSFFKKGYEYCYYRKDLVSFRGKGYKSKRSSYNQFIKNYQYKFLPYQDEMLKDCISLYDKWAGQRSVGRSNETYLHMLEENRLVHFRTLKYFKELGLVGRVVIVDNEVKAYSFGYKLNEKIFCILLKN